MATQAPQLSAATQPRPGCAQQGLTCPRVGFGEERPLEFRHLAQNPLLAPEGGHAEGAVRGPTVGGGGDSHGGGMVASAGLVGEWSGVEWSGDSRTVPGALASSCPLYFGGRQASFLLLSALVWGVATWVHVVSFRGGLVLLSLCVVSLTNSVCVSLRTCFTIILSSLVFRLIAL